MISETATGFLKRRLGDSFRFYRLFFNSIAILTLIPVLWYSHSLRQEAIFRWEGVWLADPEELSETVVPAGQEGAIMTWTRGSTRSRAGSLGPS
jgi:hypothetical protein